MQSKYLALGLMLQFKKHLGRNGLSKNSEVILMLESSVQSFHPYYLCHYLEVPYFHILSRIPILKSVPNSDFVKRENSESKIM